MAPIIGNWSAYGSIVTTLIASGNTRYKAYFSVPSEVVDEAQMLVRFKFYGDSNDNGVYDGDDLFIAPVLVKSFGNLGGLTGASISQPGTNSATSYIDGTAVGVATFEISAPWESTGTPSTPAIDPINGTIGNDLLKGTGENDVITGFGGADRKTGGLGQDIFRYTALSDSRLSSLDRITDLVIGTDKIDAPRAVSARNVKQLGKVSSLKQAGIQKVLGGNNPLGKQVFRAHRAATFTLGTGGGTLTFLAINDATPGFNANTDALIEITGFKGNLNNLGII